MATADRILQLKLVSDVGDINKQMKGVSSKFKSAAASAGKWSKAIAGAFVIKGIETLVDSFDDAIKGFKEGEDAARNLTDTLGHLGVESERAGRIIDALGGHAIDLGFDDAEVQTAFNKFLTQTDNVQKSLRLVDRAMDVARARNISFSRAVKLVAADLDENDKSLKHNRNAAEAWARHHPIEVTLGNITDLWGEFLGNLSQGRIRKSLGALSRLGGAINDLIFGKTGSKGGHIPGIVDRFADIGKAINDAIFGHLEPHKGGGPPVHVEGLIDQFAKVGPKILAAITGGLTTLGERIQTIWDEQIANVDWTKAIPDALGTFWRDTLQPFLDGLAQKGPVAAGAITAIAFAMGLLLIPTLGLSAPLVAIGLALTALLAAAATPEGQAALQSVAGGLRDLQGGLQNVQTALQNVQTWLQNVQTFLQQTFGPALDTAGSLFGTFADGVVTVLGGISTAFETVAGHIRNLLGTIANTILYLVTQWNNLMSLFGGAAQPGEPRPGSGLVWDPVTGKWKRYAKGTRSSTGGMALVGEQGPELIRLPAGSRVWSADETAAMMDGGGGWGATVVNINVTAGVGDPVEIGRQVDRVLRAYRGRSGLAAA